MKRPATLSVWRLCSRLVVPLSLLLAIGCSRQLASPTAAPTGDQAPVSLRNLQLATIDGHRAVLLRLSRLPTLVRHSSSTRPARITVQAWGPVGDSDLPERNLPQADPQVTDVRVSRDNGALRIVLDLNGDEPPAYSVHEMADWIMIRFAGSES
jgi:AMIN domain